MSVRLPKRLSSKKKKHPKNNAQAEVLNKLGLEAFWTTPLDPVSMLDISTWMLESQTPTELKNLPNAFLQRLWLLSPDARNSCCKPPHDGLSNGNESTEEMVNSFEESPCAVNPLDLVTAVFMSANTFLQQEISVRMVQCQFAVPLVLPNIDPEEPSHFLLWPLRGVMSQWRSHCPDGSKDIHGGNLASTCMPMISCVKLGDCGVSKSQVLNKVINGLGPSNETFLHRGMDGGELPRRLANGLIEIGWYLPTGDTARDIFPVPVVLSNLRGDASIHEKHLHLLCQASSAVVVFCGNLKQKDKQLLTFCKNAASKLILIDVSDTQRNDNRVVGFADHDLEADLGLPRGSVLQGEDLSEEELANGLCDTLKELLPDKLKCVTIERAATLAENLGLNVDEGAVCKKAMATVEEVLKGLDVGSDQYKEEQLPLQGLLWRKLAKIEKDERKLKIQGKEIYPQLQKEKKDVLVVLSTYKMTPAMKLFTDALFTTDKVERTCFLSWLKLKLQLIQIEKQNSTQDLFTNQDAEEINGMHYNDDQGESDSFCTDSTFEDEETEEQTLNIDQPFTTTGQELEQILQTNRLQPPQKDHLEFSDDPVIEQQSYMMSNGHETVVEEDEGESEVCFDEHIPDLIFEDQNCHLESGERGTLSCQGKQQDEPELTLAESDSSSANEQIILDVSGEHEADSSSQPFEPDMSSLSLEHFLREMGLIFELTHISPGSGNQNVLRLPSLAADLLLYGVPLELMDGDASNIPINWLGCVFAELKRRLPQEQSRIRVLTNLGLYHARNAEVLSALFGVKFPEGRKRSTRGLYMVPLCLPDNLRKDMECDLLFLMDVEGLCSDEKQKTLVQDNEMATVAAGLSDVLIQNLSSLGTELDTCFSVTVNALLRVKESGSMPICQFLVQDEGIKTVLQVSQLRRISDMLYTEDRGTTHADDHSAKNTTCIPCIKGPWCNLSISEPIDSQYSVSVLKLKQNLFWALEQSAAKAKVTSLSEFMSRFHAVWDAVRGESFSIGLQDTEIASAFSLVCTNLSQWEDSFMKHMGDWLIEAKKKIFATKAKALDTAIQDALLRELKDEARSEVKTEVDKVRLKAEAYLIRDDLLKINTFKPVLMTNIDDLQERVTEETIQRLDTVNETHCSSTQLEKFQTSLEREQDSKINALLENSKATKVLLHDAELEEAFEDVWSKLLSNFDFRPSETDDITARVSDLLKENLISRGLLKHMKKLEVIGQKQTSIFCVYDEHFGYRSRLKHMFEDNNRLQRLEAQNIACSIIEEYNQFVADKSSSPACFSDSYITELLENVEKALTEKSMEIKSAFEVDLKVYLCTAACQDFQKLHDRFAKDSELLTCICATKSSNMARFIYQFRKRDQCQRMAQRFNSMVIKPAILDYIYKPLGMRIVEQIQGKAPQYRSRCAFHQSLLEDLLNEDCFESFLEYLHSYDNFRQRKVHDAVMVHLSESNNLDKWRQYRLGEIVGMIAAAVSETAEGTSGVLSDIKPLLERVCLSLEKYSDMDVNRAALDGPLFGVTTEWDRFVSCLMEILATMRLDFAQEFSQNTDVTQFLQCLSNQPDDTLFSKVRGCDKKCPHCRAPCERDETTHEVHRALLHRPKGLYPNSSCSQSDISYPETMREDHPGQSTDTVACSVCSPHPDWNISPNIKTPCAYWSYVFARFSERFAEEYKQEPANIPEEWKKITKEEALFSLKEAFPGWC